MIQFDVGDGCRADSAFEFKEDGEPRMPFLHSICLEKGSFGVSHTRVPTESRPGHIAMIAGFYEDVSAVTKGWKANPVDYDHVLARARYAWSFGAPEIVDLFSGPRVTGAHYSAELIDFATSDAKQLDQWSFDRLKELFEAASVDEELAARLRSDQIVIFVHLLGLDTNGHAFKPHSPEYLGNVEFVDAGIKQAVKMIEDFYGNDGKTAFIYTADHGMSDAGTHGDGDPQNTRTPLVAWGAGISEPQPITLGLRDDHDGFSAGWGLSHLRRRDIQQADMTPLMASLVGIPVPVNSEGILPVKLLGSSQEQRCRALHDNARQISASYQAKESLKASREPFFRPALVSATQIQASLTKIEELIAARAYSDAQRLSFSTIKASLAGLAYLHKYDAALLKGICAAGYLGWMAYVLLFLLKHHTGGHVVRKPKSAGIASLFALLYGGLTLFLMAKGSPLQYHLYAAFAAGLWHQTFQSNEILRSAILQPFLQAHRLPTLMAYFVGLELLVLTFFQRGVLVALNAALAVALAVRHGRAHPKATAAWLVACIAMAALPLRMEPIKQANDTLFLLGALSIGTVALLGYHVARPERIVPFIARLGLIAMAAGLAKDSDARLAAKAGLPFWNQNVAWLLLTFSLAAPILLAARKPSPGASRASVRLLDLFMCLAPAYILLSISYEPLFYALFALQLAAWIGLESGNVSTAGEFVPLGLDHLWIAFGFLFFVNLAFFGTGNMASISSFTLSSVYRFMTVFAPFPMAALLILKLLLPFALLAAAFGVLAKRSGTPPFGLVLLVVATTDIMTLNFFFLVRDHGSWLEIGTSISHFIIASSLIIFTLILAGLASFLLKGVRYHERVGEQEERHQHRQPHQKIE